jgi:hypothetical protein
MRDFTVDEIRAVLEAKGFDFFDGGKPYNLNLIGVRNDIQKPERFDDAILAVYRDESERWQVETFQSTTDPGLYWLRNPMRDAGTAILCPGQYPGCYRIGTHQHYKALEQIGNMTYVRDDDQDDRLDLALMHKKGQPFTDVIATNLHRADDTERSEYNYKWSAGCQVIADPEEFEMLLSICHDSAKIFGNRFTYTLLTIEDFR